MRWDNFGSQLDRKSKTWFFTFLNVYISWIKREKVLISQLSPLKFRYFADQNEPKGEPYESEFWQFSKFFGNLRTMTLEGKKETRQMTPLFSSTVWALTVCDIYFCIWKLSKFIFMESPLWSILVYKLPEFWRWKLWDKNFVPFDSGNVNIEESKIQVLLFLSSLDQILKFSG